MKFEIESCTTSTSKFNNEGNFTLLFADKLTESDIKKRGSQAAEHHIAPQANTVINMPIPLNLFHLWKQEPADGENGADFGEIYETPSNDGPTAQWDPVNVNEKTPNFSEPTTPVSQEDCYKKKSSTKSAIRKFFGVKKSDHSQDDNLPAFPPDHCKEWSVNIE